MIKRKLVSYALISTMLLSNSGIGLVQAETAEGQESSITNSEVLDTDDFIEEVNSLMEEYPIEGDIFEEFATKRLMVDSGYTGDDYDAVEVIVGEDYTVLQYETLEEVENAYEELSKDKSSDVGISFLLKVENDSMGSNEDETLYYNKVNQEYLGLDQMQEDMTSDKEVGVAIIDSGVDKSYLKEKGFSEEQLGRVVVNELAEELEQEQGAYIDNNGVSHGSLVAGVILDSTPDNVKVYSKQIYGTTIEEQEGEYTESMGFMNMLDSLSEDDNVDIINISQSFSLPTTSTDEDGNVYDTLESFIGALDSNGNAFNKNDARFKQLSDCIDKCLNKGKIVVCSAGNYSQDTLQYYFPACYEPVITASASMLDGSLASYSNYGFSYYKSYPSIVTYGGIDFASLGEIEKGIAGTSFSSPYIASMISCLLSKGYGSTQKEIELLLKGMCNDDDCNPPSGKSIMFAFGNGIPRYTGDIDLGDIDINHDCDEDGHVYDLVDYSYNCLEGGTVRYQCNYSHKDNKIEKKENILEKLEGISEHNLIEIPSSPDELPEQSEDDGIEWERISPTCTENAKYRFYCNNYSNEDDEDSVYQCNYYYETEFLGEDGIPVKEEDRKLGHDEIEVVTKDSNCTEEGEVTIYCKRVGCSNYEGGVPLKTVTTPALGHDYDVPLKEDGTIDWGYIQENAEVSLGGYDVPRDEISNILWDELRETEGYETGLIFVNNICGDEGYIARAQELCSRCNEPKEYIDFNEKNIARQEHKISEVLTSPECEADGSKVLKCEVCGKEFSSEGIPLEGHSWKQIEKTVQNCITEGKIVTECEKCGKVNTVVIPKDGGKHAKLKEITVAPTCHEDGYSYFECEACGKTNLYKTLKPQTSHRWELKESKPATTEEEGYSLYVCMVCGDERKSVIKKLSSSTSNSNQDSTINNGNNEGSGGTTDSTQQTTTQVSTEVEAGESTVENSSSKISTFSTSKNLKSAKSNKKKQIKIALKKKPSEYSTQVQVSTSKKFKNAKSTKFIGTSVVIKKLTSGKKYYVRLRFYKRVSNRIKYGKWSATKTVKVK